MKADRLGDALAALLFPEEGLCPFCGEPAGRADALCPVCAQEAPRHGHPRCPLCGLQTPEPGLCAGCRREPRAFDGGRSVFRYEGVARRAVHRMKFQGAWYLCRFFSGEMAGALREAGWRADCIVPVPAHPLRRLDRGCNLPDRMARHLSRLTGLTVLYGALRRVTWRTRMPGRGVQGRKETARASYRLGRRPAVAGKTVLLVDDILTTGATLDACAALLKQAGAARVYVLTAAGADDASQANKGGKNP